MTSLTLWKRRGESAAWSQTWRTWGKREGFIFSQELQSQAEIEAELWTLSFDKSPALTHRKKTWKVTFMLSRNWTRILVQMILIKLGHVGGCLWRFTVKYYNVIQLLGHKSVKIELVAVTVSGVQSDCFLFRILLGLLFMLCVGNNISDQILKQHLCGKHLLFCCFLYTVIFALKAAKSSWKGNKVFQFRSAVCIFIN